jgi:hypothetical protein
MRLRAHHQSTQPAPAPRSPFSATAVDSLMLLSSASASLLAAASSWFLIASSAFILLTSSLASTIFCRPACLVCVWGVGEEGQGAGGAGQPSKRG